MRKTSCTIILTLLCLSLSGCCTIAESKTSTELAAVEETTEAATADETTEITTTEATTESTTAANTKDSTADQSNDQTSDTATNSTASKSDTSSSTDTTTAANTDSSSDVEYYKSVLDSIYDIVSGANIDVEADDSTIGLIESSTGYAEEALANVGYCTRDLNKDGRNELLIIDNRDADNRILDIYSLDENYKPICLVGGWARNKYYLTEDDYITNIGSSGADSTAYITYSHSKETNSLIPFDCYFTDYKDESMEQLGWYHNTIGTLLKTESEWLGDIYDDALTAEIENKYTNYATLDLVYFKDYQK